MHAHEPQRLLILYGSETGNAQARGAPVQGGNRWLMHHLQPPLQDVAERIAREARRRHYNPSCSALDAYDLQGLADEPFVVFVVATTGQVRQAPRRWLFTRINAQGEPPSNMRNSWRLLLRKSLPPTALAGLPVAVFGLGDSGTCLHEHQHSATTQPSGYVQYNVMAKKLDRRLLALGAQPLLPRGLGDDQARGGYEAALDAWLPQLWTALRARVPLPPGCSDVRFTDGILTQALACTCLHVPQPTGEQGPLEPPRLQCTWLPRQSTAQSTAQSTRSLEEELAARAALERLLRGGVEQGELGQQGAQPSSMAPMLARVVSNDRITARDHFQDTRHVVLDAPGARVPQYCVVSPPPRPCLSAGRCAARPAPPARRCSARGAAPLRLGLGRPGAGAGPNLARIL